MSDRTKAIVFALIIVAAFLIGDYVMRSAFFGIVMLTGLVALIEAIKPLKWFVRKTSKVLDVLIFMFTIIATASYGLNITAGLTIAGLGYTLVYAPYIRKKAPVKKQKPLKGKANYDCR